MGVRKQFLVQALKGLKGFIDPNSMLNDLEWISPKCYENYVRQLESTELTYMLIYSQGRELLNRVSNVTLVQAILKCPKCASYVENETIERFFSYKGEVFKAFWGIEHFEQVRFINGCSFSIFEQWLISLTDCEQIKFLKFFAKLDGEYILDQSAIQKIYKVVDLCTPKQRAKLVRNVDKTLQEVKDQTNLLEMLEKLKKSDVAEQK